jgi:hypothetical protein
MRAIAQLLEDYVNQLFVHCALEPYNEDVKRVFYEFRDFLRG